MTRAPRRRAAAALAAAVLVALLPAASSQDGSDGKVSSSASVRNERPTVLLLDLSASDADSDSPGVQVSPVPGGKAVVRFNVSAEDGNGGADLRRAEVEVRGPDGSVVVPAFSAREKGEPRGRVRQYEGSFELEHYRRAGEYTVHLLLKDRNEASAVANASFHYEELLAISVGVSSISFGDGALSPGSSTHGKASAIPVRNGGNVPIDLRLSAGPLWTQDRDASIAPDRLKYSRLVDMTDERPLSAAGIVDEQFDLAPGASSVRNAHVDIHVPTGDEQYVPAATYTGEITIGAVVG